MLPGIRTDVWSPSLVHPSGEGSGLVQMWPWIMAGCDQEARLPVPVSLPRCSRVRNSGEGQAPGPPEAVLPSVPALWAQLSSAFFSTVWKLLLELENERKTRVFRTASFSVAGRHNASQLLLSPSVSSAVGGGACGRSCHTGVTRGATQDTCPESGSWGHGGDTAQLWVSVPAASAGGRHAAGDSGPGVAVPIST